MTNRQEGKSVEERLNELEDQLHLQNVAFLKKFYFFFTGLVFAVLSLAIQHPTESKNSCIKISESAGWILLVITSFFALREIGAFRLKDCHKSKIFKSLSKCNRFLMYLSFILGIIFLLLAKIIHKFIIAPT